MPFLGKMSGKRSTCPQTTKIHGRETPIYRGNFTKADNFNLVCSTNAVTFNLTFFFFNLEIYLEYHVQKDFCPPGPDRAETGLDLN